MTDSEKKRILLIDDDKFMHRMIQLVLERAGLQLFSAYNGASGLEILLKEKPDLVLLDYLMPDMDGNQVYQEITTNKKYAGCASIPILFLTAVKAKEQIREEYIRAGLSAYLTKPFGSNELINVIENTLSAHKIRVRDKHLLEITRQAKNFLEDLISSSPDAIITLDVKGNITFFSSGAEAMLGYSSAEIHKNHFSNICRSDVEIDKIFERVKKNKKIRYIEMSFQAQNGKQIPVSFSFSLLQDSDEKLIGYLGIGKDISEIKRLEKELIEKERLAALMEATAAINHEINNPLTPILGNIQLLLTEEDKLSPDVRNKLKSIEKNAWRVHSIIKKLEQITRPIQTTYYGNIKMLDIENSR